MGEKPPKLGIRPALAGDVDAIVGVHLAAALTGFADIFPPSAPKPTHEWLRPRWQELVADPDVATLVAEATDLLGCAVVRPEAEVPTQILLDRLYVRPDRWGKGIGSLLHEAAIEIAASRGDAINLWVLEANTRARGMYERRGWRLVPGWTLPNRQPGIIDVLYQRALADRCP